MISPFEQLWSAKFLQGEIIDMFGEFDESRWNLDAGTEDGFDEYLEQELPLDDFYRNNIGFVYQSCWNCAVNDERSKYLAIREYAHRNGYTTAMDYGCGIGSGVVTLGLAGMDKVVGADVCKPNLDFLRARVKRFGLEDTVKVVDLYGKSTRHKADLLICTEVVEHVEDPVGLMHKLHKRVNDGGAMIMSWSFVNMPTHLQEHFDKGWQHTHPDLVTEEGFGKVVLMDQLGMKFDGHTWFNNTAWKV
ncbi:MAG: class I SAM-dependent methyltransferase [Candidatus Thorarchaeota archaeon]|jgi:hypothetical protein